MKYLEISASSQDLYFIPRTYNTSVIVTLRNDSTNNTATINLPTCVREKNYLKVSSIFTVEEGFFYDLKVYENSVSAENIIYRDKIFATDQSIDQTANEYYDINKDEYVSEEANNDFIIL
tara:strand:- start:231 stop:590 length:360 start_codon:yes stop_codon:yes gene_type:complete